MSAPTQAPPMTDAVLAAGAISTPFWLQLLTEGIGIYVAIGGAVLITLRIMIAIRDCRKKEDG